VNGWPAPASRRTRCQKGRSDGSAEKAGEKIERVSLKTCQQQHVSFTPMIDEPTCPNLFEPALLQGRAAGVGQPFTKRIWDFGFAIFEVFKEPTSRKSQIKI
jgi:hypothetical protein